MVYEILSPIVANLIPAGLAVFFLWNALIRPVLELIGRRVGSGVPVSPPLSAEALAFRRGYGPEIPWVGLALMVALACMIVKAHDDYVIKLLRGTVVQMDPTVDPASADGDGLPRFMEFGDGTQHTMRWGCTEGCSGHIAGWKWAAEHRVMKDAQCDGSNSGSFAEGCRVYLWRMGYDSEPD